MQWKEGGFLKRNYDLQKKVDVGEQLQQIQETVRKILKQELPKYSDCRAQGEFPRKLFETLSENSMAGLSVPEEHGGLGLTARSIAGVFEAIAAEDLGPAVFLSVHSMVSTLISKHGSDFQRKRLLPKLAAGTLLGAFALSEPNAGSDAQAIRTSYSPSGSGFQLSGEKCWITSAGAADLYVVFAKKKQSSPRSSISAFLVPADTPGLTVGSPEKKMGAELSPIAAVAFAECELPKDALLGEEGEGYRIALGSLAGGRINIAACANGVSQHAIDLATSHLKQRKQFQKLLAEFQGLQFMVAEMVRELEAAKLLTERAIQSLEQEEGAAEITFRAALAKWSASDAAMRITTDAVQLLGGAGYVREYGAEQLMRDAKMLQIVEGTNQIQRLIVARSALDL